jgi:hypothetical protein
MLTPAISAGHEFSKRRRADDGNDHCDGEQREPRQNRRQHLGLKRAADEGDIGGLQSQTEGWRKQPHGEPNRKDQQACRKDEEREPDDQSSRRDGEKRSSDSRPPPVETSNAPAAPDSFRLPQTGSAVNRRKKRVARANAVSRDEIDLDAGLLQRPQDASVVRAGRAGAGQNERRSEAGPIGSLFGGWLRVRVVGHHFRLRREW